MPTLWGVVVAPPSPPTPSWPASLEPQQKRRVSSVTPQVWAPPADSPAKVSCGAARTGRGAHAVGSASTVQGEEVGVPSCPRAFRPQHQARPSGSRPQAWWRPTERLS